MRIRLRFFQRRRMSSKLCVSGLVALFLLLMILYYFRPISHSQQQQITINGNAISPTSAGLEGIDENQELADSNLFLPTTNVRRWPTLNKKSKMGENLDVEVAQRKGRLKAVNLAEDNNDYEIKENENNNVNRNLILHVRNKKIRHPDEFNTAPTHSINYNKSWSSVGTNSEKNNEIAPTLKDKTSVRDKPQLNRPVINLQGGKQNQRRQFSPTAINESIVNGHAPLSEPLQESELHKRNNTSIEDTENNKARYDNQNLMNKLKVRLVNKEATSVGDYYRKSGNILKKLDTSNLNTFSYSDNFERADFSNEGNKSTSETVTATLRKNSFPQFDKDNNRNHADEKLNSKKEENQAKEKLRDNFNIRNITRQVMKLRQNTAILYKEAYLNYTYLTFYRETKPRKNSKRFSVLLLHASAFSSATWLTIGTLETLAESGFRTVAIDIPGFGKSKQSKIPYSERDILEYMINLLIDLRLGSCAIVAPSRAGDFAMPLVMRHPDLVQAFVAIAPTYTSKFKTKRYQEIQIPTLVIFGENDGTRLHIASLDNLEHLGNRKIYMIRNATHPCYLDKPRTFHKLLERFLYNTEAKMSSEAGTE